jgi:arsenate reductase
MTEPTIYHNPRCSKSRQTLALLHENGVKPNVVEYLNDMPDKTTLKKILASLGIKPHDVLRTKEAEYKQAGLSRESSDNEILDALIKYPKLLERPVVVKGKKAAIGRPPEKVLEIL